MTQSQKEQGRKIEDKAIEYGGKSYSLRKILDSEASWSKYVNGSDNFKQAVELGVVLQLGQLISLSKISKTYAK